MSSPATKRDDQRIARALGLKVQVYQHLRAALARDEELTWLRTADPELAGLFPNALGFELLCERIQSEEALERRRANIARSLEGKDMPEIESAVAEAGDEGELEDLALALEPSPAPDGWEKPEREEHGAFVDRLRGDVGVARDLRRLFRDKAVIHVKGVEEGEKDGGGPYKQYVGRKESLLSLQPNTYLILRRGERAHALHLEFELSNADLRTLFDRSVQGFPPQEREAYLKLFLDFVDRERLTRYIQEARARLKRNAENLALQQAWQHLENALDRGHHEGFVLGMCVLRGNKLMLALLDPEGNLLRTTALPAKADDLTDRLDQFLGEEKPGLVAAQADAATRPSREQIKTHLSQGESKVRVATVPVAVVKTMLREVARRPGETHLTHDERQALMLARLVGDPRNAAFHTPHVVRAYIPFRGEINSRRLEAFEVTFLQALLYERGVDLNHGSHDMLGLVPGLDGESVELEKATAPYRSLEDFQARMGLPPAAWRAACCFLRVRDGDNGLDARPLHPIYYSALQAALNGSELQTRDLLRDPSKVQELDWEPILEARGWKKGVVDRIRHGLMRSGRRLRRGGRPTGQRLEGLTIGQVLRGTVSSLRPYGAFVDVGMRREGLLHISEMADTFVKDPAEVVQAGQEVMVRVISVDVENQRFRLSMRTEVSAGRGRGDGGEGREDQRSDNRGPTRNMRPKSRPGGGRGRGDRDGRGGGGRGGGGRRDGRRRREEVETGPDPKAKREEFDPTNPFYQFFTQNRDAVDGVTKGSAPKGTADGEKGESKEKEEEGGK